MDTKKRLVIKSPDISQLLADVLEGHRLMKDEALILLQSRNRDMMQVLAAADLMREQRVGDRVTYVKNHNINVTNFCINSCGFCGFCRKEKDDDLYTHSLPFIDGKVREALTHDITEICTVSGLHPDFTGQSYIDIINTIHKAAPDIHIHASNPMEVAYGAEKSGITTTDLLAMMKDAGLGTLCGTAAEILVDDIRDKICPQKIDSKTWERIIRESHHQGIRSTATIMYGHIESPEDQIQHLQIIRDIQDDTKGFTEFVPLSYVHYNSPLYLQGKARPGATGSEDLLMYAVSRLFLDNIDNLQASWVKMGTKMAQLCLLAGANDLSGTMYEESISKKAGAMNTDYLDPSEMKRITEDISRTLYQRTTLYEIVKKE